MGCKLPSTYPTEIYDWMGDPKPTIRWNIIHDWKEWRMSLQNNADARGIKVTSNNGFCILTRSINCHQMKTKRLRFWSESISRVVIDSLHRNTSILEATIGSELYQPSQVVWIGNNGIWLVSSCWIHSQEPQIEAVTTCRTMIRPVDVLCRLIKK